MKPRYTIYLFSKDEVESALTAGKRTLTLQVISKGSSSCDSGGAQPAGGIHITYVHVNILKAD